MTDRLFRHCPRGHALDSLGQCPICNPAPAGGTTPPELPGRWLGLCRRSWLILGCGLAAAITVVWAFPLLAFICAHLNVLVHEMSHATVAWLFGFPALPAFDFREGGGFSHTSDSRSWLVLGIYAFAVASFFWSFRQRKRLLLTGASLLVMWLILSLGPWRWLCSYSGHGGELVFAAIFLWWTFAIEEQPRPDGWLAGFLGMIMILHNLGFAWSLLTEAEAQERYLAGKMDGAATHDFVKLGQDLLGSAQSYQVIAGFHLVASLLVAPAVWLAYRYQAVLGRWLGRLLA